MLVPKLRFPGFEDEWQVVALRNIASKGQYGINAAAKEFDGVNKYLRITDIDESSHTFSQANLTSPSGKIDDQYLLRHNDLLFARTGASVGKSYTYNDKDGKVYFAGFLIRFRILDANAKFVFYHTLRGDYDTWVKVMSARSGQPGINADEYGGLKLTAPSIKEQKKIANFLTAVDERIELQSHKVEKLEIYKRGLTQKIFTHTLRFKRDDGTTFPEWEIVKLGGVALVKKGVQLNRDSMEQKGFPVINGGVEPSGYTSSYNTEKDNITVSEGGNSCGFVNYIKERFWSGGHCYVVCENEHINKMFLFQILKYRQLDIMKLRVGSGLPNIQKKDFENMRLNIPVSAEEQQKIATLLSQIDEKIILETEKLEGLKKFKKALLQRMFV